MTSSSEWFRILQGRKPGDVIPITFERRGQPVSAMLRLVEDSRVQAIAAEEQTLSVAQRAFRTAWLSSAARQGGN